MSETFKARSALSNVIIFNWSNHWLSQIPSYIEWLQFVFFWHNLFSNFNHYEAAWAVDGVLVVVVVVVVAVAALAEVDAAAEFAAFAFP